MPLSFSISPVSATIQTTREEEFIQVRKARTVGEPGAGRSGAGRSGGGVSASFRQRALPPLAPPLLSVSAASASDKVVVLPTWRRP